MKKLLSFLPFSLLLMSMSCNENEPSYPTNPSLPPVETLPANTDYEPAFAGQTRAPGAKTQTEIKHTLLASGLSKPWGIVELPDGRFLITEKTGTMRIMENDGTVSDKITGLPPVNSSGQGGLLGLTLDPDFATNKMVYFVFSENNSGGTLTAVGKGKLSSDEKSLESVSVIYRAIPAFNSTLHYGGRILFDHQGYLIFTTGERSNIDSRPLAQTLDKGFGKIIRITKDGNPAPGGPFVSINGALPELFTYGHRNTQGIAFHPITRDLWQNEFGPKGGDELNIVAPGKNYGWPIITYGLEYSGAKIGEGITQKEGMEQPVYYWDPVISPSGMTFYNHDAIPEWKNNLFIGCLSGQHIARLIINGDKVIGEERLLSALNERFRDITQGQDGALYSVTDGGKVYKIAKK